MELGACLSCGRGPGTTSRSSFYRRSVFGGCYAFRFFARFSRTVDVGSSAFGIPHGEEAENFPPGPRDHIILVFLLFPRPAVGFIFHSLLPSIVPPSPALILHPHRMSD